MENMSIVLPMLPKLKCVFRRFVTADSDGS